MKDKVFNALRVTGRAIWAATKWTAHATWRTLAFAAHTIQWIVPIFGLMMWRFRVSKRRHAEVIARSND